jgi:hypothetical protein
MGQEPASENSTKSKMLVHSTSTAFPQGRAQRFLAAKRANLAAGRAQADVFFRDCGLDESLAQVNRRFDTPGA